MLSFLFEYYGYYPNNFLDNSFEIDNWFFILVETVNDVEYIDQIDEFVSVIRSEFKGPYIIKNRFNEKMSYHDGKWYTLISMYKYNVDIKDLNKFHVLFKETEKSVDLKKISLLWEKKMNFIENECVHVTENVVCENNLEITMFCLGLCQNAIQYLNDAILDYGSVINDVTLTHKRLFTLSSCEVFNPFNFVIDHPLRDYVELYKNNFIDFDEMINALEYYEIDSKLASVIIARTLYPARVFDLLEDGYYGAFKKINYSIEKEILKIKNIYLYFKKKYRIRPILWLEDY